MVIIYIRTKLIIVRLNLDYYTVEALDYAIHYKDLSLVNILIQLGAGKYIENQENAIKSLEKSISKKQVMNTFKLLKSTEGSEGIINALKHYIRTHKKQYDDIEFESEYTAPNG